MNRSSKAKDIGYHIRNAVSMKDEPLQMFSHATKIEALCAGLSIDIEQTRHSVTSAETSRLEHAP